MQAIIDFQNWTMEKTGHRIGAWLHVVHELLGMKPAFIGSHTVDGAGNAGLSVKTLSWRTEGQRGQTIIANPCNVHRISTSADQATGTSKHKKCLNPALASSLKLLHWWLVKFSNYTAPKTSLKNVHAEEGREKVMSIVNCVVTRWLSRHKEAACASSNQKDLAIAINRVLAPGGTYAKMHFDEDDDSTRRLQRSRFRGRTGYFINSTRELFGLSRICWQ